MDWAAFKESARRIVVGLCGRPAAPLVSVAEPFAGLNGLGLDLVVDGVAHTLTFAAGDDTAADVAARVELAIAGVAKRVAPGTKVGLFSLKAGGTDSRIQVTGGTANAVLGFPTTESTGTGLPDAMVLWQDEAQPHVYPDAKVGLDIIGYRGVGQDELVGSDGPGNTLELTQRGPRTVLVQIMAEALTHRGEAFAFRWLADVRDRFFWYSTQLALEAASLGILDVAEVRKFGNFVVDQRTYSRATLDVRFSAWSSTKDESYDGSWIERAEVWSPFLSEDVNPMVIPP
jgi:hypothetical protein